MADRYQLSEWSPREDRPVREIRGRSRARAGTRGGLPALLCVSLLMAIAPAAGQSVVRDPPDGGYAGSLPFHYDLYTFRGADGGTAVVAAFAVQAGELEAERWRNLVRYRFDVTLVLADTALHSVSRTDDSVFVALRRRPPGDHLLYTHIAVEAPPSRTTVQRVVMTDASVPGAGQLYHSGFPIPDYTGAGLMLSDIALGERTGPGGWKRGDVSLALLPASLFPAGSFNVYYEIYNLPRGHRYTTEVLVEPVGGATRAREPVGLRFAGDAELGPRGMVQELRHVQAMLEPGRYRMTVEVTDQQTGAVARRSRLFTVTGWAPGTTPVVALPRSAVVR